MAAARGTPGSTGLGDLDLNTSAVALGELVTTELGEDGARGFADPWARFAEQLGWDELRVAPSAAEREPALEHFAEDRPLLGSDGGPAAGLAPRTPPGPEFAAQVAPRPSRGAPPTSPASPGSSELPTDPALSARPASGPRAQWQARAQELGLYSVFIAAADDFSGAAPALGPDISTAPPPPAAATATAEPFIPPSAPLQPPPSASATSEAALPAGPLAARQSSASANSVAADAVQVVKKSLHSGRQLLKQLLRGSATAEPAAKAPPPPPPPPRPQGSD